MLALSAWRAGSRLQLHSPASQRRCAASSAVMEPLEGAPDLAAAPAAAAAAAADPLPPQQQDHHHQQQQQQQQHHGAIEIVVGPMFAGKTTELLRRVQRYEAAGLSVAVVKSSKDDRYSAAHVVTHDGLKRVGGWVGGEGVSAGGGGDASEWVRVRCGCGCGQVPGAGRRAAGRDAAVGSLCACQAAT